MDLIKKYYKKRLDDLDINDDAANNRLSVVEKRIKKSDSFMIDVTPSDAASTPRYTSLSKNALTNEKQQQVEEEESNQRISSANKCFNCDKSTHSLRDCPEPRNMTKIRSARNVFNRKEIRYHVDDDEFSQMTPGKYSDDLKEALGIISNELPLFVYKMRMYGYSPSWLEEAKLFNSGLSLFVEKDKVQSNLDDYEIRNYKYDLQKIYEFAGFNVAVEPPFVDKHRLLNLPPMQPQDSKENFIKSLGDSVVNGYKKRKLRNDHVTNGNDESTYVEADMEIDNDDEEDVEPTPPGVSIQNTPVQINTSQNENVKEKSEEEEEGEISDSSSPASPSADQLEIQRNQLLSELQNTSAASILNESKSSSAEQPNSLQSQPSLEDISSFIEYSVNENLDNNAIQIGHVETTVYGTTVLPSFTPFDNLPAGEKFQEGVCDVIAFENLAESTGKYEKMKGLIKKVRCLLKEHQKE